MKTVGMILSWLRVVVQGGGKRIRRWVKKKGNTIGVMLKVNCIGVVKHKRRQQKMRG